jgi:hypothetical protein
MCAPSVGALCEGTSHKLYEREKGYFKERQTYYSKVAFKGTGTFFALKEYLNKKNLKGKKVLYKFA